MVCDPSKNNINIGPIGPSPFLPGMGSPFSVPKIPFPDNVIPDNIPEDIIDLIDKFFALFPAGIKFIPNPDAFFKSVWDALASLFNQLAPFLGFYKFIQALLNIIMCIIDVLCALFKPKATLKAVKRLFKQCLPDFLSLFPWFALLIMILALILLLIALIQYIIEVIIAYIKQIVENLQVLYRGFQLNDEDAVLAAVNKISYLLCMIEQLFAILLAIGALIAIVEPLMGLFGRRVCARGSSDCCTEDFCPDFIVNGPDGHFSTSGHLIYQNPIPATIPLDPAFDFLRNISLPKQRDERWQFVDDNPGIFKFIDIITPSPEYEYIYWPEPDEYASNTHKNQVPYLLDLNLSVNPAQWGNPSDGYGLRPFIIRDVIVRKCPTISPIAWNNETNTSINTGSLYLGGGTVWEELEDGYSQYFINGQPASLDTFLTKGIIPGKINIPLTDDSYNILDIEYIFKYNYDVLVEKTLITMMCQPEGALEAEVVNAEYDDIRSALDKVGPFPNIGVFNKDRSDGTGAIGCLARSLTKFRNDINAENAAIFELESTACLKDLQSQAESFYCSVAGEAADRFQSEASLSPEMQFIDNKIIVSVQLKDKTGTVIGTNLSEDLAKCLADLVTGQVTLGSITGFTYDGYDSFTADITSTIEGEGELKVYLKEAIFAEIKNRDSDEPSEITDRAWPYEFIGKLEGDKAHRFDMPDIAEDGR